MLCDYCRNKGNCLLAACRYRDFVSKGNLSFNGAFISPHVLDKLETFVEKCDNNIAVLSPLDSNKIGVTLLVTTYSGKKPRNTLKDIDIWIADIGNVGNKFADVYLKQCLSDHSKKAHPVRLSRMAGKIYKII